MTPTVSVIVPNYNHASFLKERIDSVLNQDFGDYEVIILDDCSSDNSREIIELYRHNPKISHIVYNSKNSGSTFKQWEKGINLAKGEIIWIAESDDVAESEFLSFLVPLMKEESADIIFSGSHLINQESKLIEKDFDIHLRINLTKGSKYSKYHGKEFLKSYMVLRNAIYNASAVLFKKELWNKIEHDFVDIKSSGDWLCWIRMLLESRNIVWYSAKLNRFRQHSNKVSPKALANGLLFVDRKYIVDYLTSLDEIGPIMKIIIIGASYFEIYKYLDVVNNKDDILKLWNTSYSVPVFYMNVYKVYSYLSRIKRKLQKIHNS